MTALYYEIRVVGTLPPEALTDFQCLSTHRQVETTLYGPLPDQAALHGLLARLETYGAHLIEVRRVRGSEPPEE